MCAATSLISCYRDLMSGSHICMSSAVPTEPHAQPIIGSCLNNKSHRYVIFPFETALV